MSTETRESLKVLQECADIQKRKSEDYQASVSDVTQADYYLYGVDSIYDMMHTKMLRIQSVLDKMRAGHDANFESVEDSAKDLINYSSFLVAFLRRKIPGQDNSKDLFGNKIVDNGAQEPGVFKSSFLTEKDRLVYVEQSGVDVHNLFARDS